MHSNNIPKGLKKALERHAEVVDSYHMEQDGFGEGNEGPWSIWIYLKNGYIIPHKECGTSHAATAKKAIESFKYVVREG